MKKTLLASLTAALTLMVPGLIAETIAAAQHTGPVTTIGKLMARKELLLVKEMYVLGKISGLYSSSGDINAIVAYDPAQKENRLKGLIFTIREGRSEDRTYTSYLDFDEIEGLASGMASIETLSGERRKADSTYTEITYTTIDNLTFGAYIGNGEEEVFITAGESESDKITIYLEPERLKDIRKIVDYGYTLLKMK